MKHPAVLHAAAMAASQYARAPASMKLLAGCGAAPAMAAAMVRLAEWASTRLPCAQGPHASQLPLHKSLLEAAALATWGAVTAATQFDDAKLPAELAASLAAAIGGAVAAGAPARQALYLLTGSAAALARETSGYHAAALVTAGGVEALQAALDCLPRGAWGAFERLVGCHAASALGLLALHVGDGAALWRGAEATLEGVHRPALNRRNVMLTLLNTLGPKKRFQHQEMEEVAGSAIMLLATHYHHVAAAEYSEEVHGLAAAVRYVAEGADCVSKSPEQRARVLQYLLAACWGMLRQVRAPGVS
jgi:hypothetical protein